MASIHACIAVFSSEYDDEWINAFEELEQWVSANDQVLEATKPAAGDA